MLIRGIRAAALGAALALAAPALATADITIGSAAIPAAPETHERCEAPALGGDPGLVLYQLASDPSTSYAAPAGVWLLTDWQTNVVDADPGARPELVVLHPTGTGSYSVLGTDTEALPAVPPADGIAKFTLSTPILIQGGDTIGLYAASFGFTCWFDGDGLPAADVVTAFIGTTPPAAGQTLSPPPGAPVAQSNARVNVAATLEPAVYDAGVSLTAGPSNATVGQPAVLAATVTNNGPAVAPITFTDPIPRGLSVQYAGADSGECTTSTATNIVTCTFPNLAVGTSGKVAIVVTPSAAQSYSDPATVSVRDGANDPNAANNSASVNLNVAGAGPSGPTKCVVPKLGGASVALVKKVLPQLGCKAGKSKKAHSKKVAKGHLIGTSPGAGSYTVNKVIGLKVSSGPPPKKKHKK